ADFPGGGAAPGRGIAAGSVDVGDPLGCFGGGAGARVDGNQQVGADGFGECERFVGAEGVLGGWTSGIVGCRWACGRVADAVAPVVDIGEDTAGEADEG